MKNVTKVNFYEKVVGQKHFMIKQTEERKMWFWLMMQNILIMVYLVLGLLPDEIITSHQSWSSIKNKNAFKKIPFIWPCLWLNYGDLHKWDTFNCDKLLFYSRDIELPIHCNENCTRKANLINICFVFVSSPCNVRKRMITLFSWWIMCQEFKKLNQ